MPVIEQITLGVWVLLELTLRVREHRAGRGGIALDRWTRGLIALSLAGGFSIAALLTHPGARLFPGGRACGIALMWAGIGLRMWAILALGDSFRTSVEVHEGQQVIERGPYRWLRHPSYTGILLIAIGIGVADGTWPSVAVAFVLPLAALIHRISVEEHVLLDSLGQPYADYKSRTKRLIPRVW
ncbi:MAG: isoprenylcysteine carboxylmethyltransferase family protein [Actinomycetota bacterium]|nr:isoprenylcysteine carboxylmethyltransferase family protein [Actinomycetota bacterium]